MYYLRLLKSSPPRQRPQKPELRILGRPSRPSPVWTGMWHLPTFPSLLFSLLVPSQSFHSPICSDIIPVKQLVISELLASTNWNLFLKTENGPGSKKWALRGDGILGGCIPGWPLGPTLLICSTCFHNTQESPVPSQKLRQGRQFTIICAPAGKQGRK